MSAASKGMLKVSVVVLGIVLLAEGMIVSGCQFPVQVIIERGEQGAGSRIPGHSAVERAAFQPAVILTPTVGPQQLSPTPEALSAPILVGVEVANRVARPITVKPAASPPTRIVIPALGLDVPVTVMGWQLNPKTGQPEWQIPANAAGFHSDSALPGWPGNTVLSGHHNIAGKVFDGLWNLQPGDIVDLYVGKQLYRYRVEDVMIVPERGASEEQRRQNAQWIAPTKDERLTLVTCWPPNDNSHRTIVIARPVWLGQEVSKR